MSLQEVRQGQAQSLAPKKTVPQTPTTPTVSKKLPSPFPEIDFQKSNEEAQTPAIKEETQQTTVQTRPIINEPQPVQQRPAPTTPLEVLGIYTEEKYEQLPKAEAGRFFVTPTRPGYVKDVMTGTTIPQPAWTEQEKEYMRLKSSQFMGTNIWQATGQGAQEIFSPTKINKATDPLAETRWENWQKLPFDVKQQVIQGSQGTFENPLGIQTWRYYFTGDEKGAFTDIYDPYMQRLGEKFKSPLSAAEFMAFETIPGAYYGFKGFSKGLGYVKELGPAGAQVSQSINRAVGIYFATETIKGASEAAKQGPEAIGKYALSTGAMLGVGAFGMKSFKAGELAGKRKRFASNIKTDEGIAKANTLFAAMDRATNISSRNIEPLDLNVVENLRGNFKQQIALRNALSSKEIKPYKVVLGGSAAGFEPSPHDTDILIGRTWLKPFLFNEQTRVSLVPKVELGKTSNVAIVKNIFKAYGVDLSLYDIHDLPKVGEPFPQVGTGYAQKPIRIPGYKSIKPIGEKGTITQGFLWKKGYLDYYIKDNSVVIKDIRAFPEGKGTGTKLINKLIEKSPGMEIKTDVALPEAIPFYKKIGFSETGESGVLSLKTKPITTSIFKYQISLSEQAGRKIASAWAPLHEYRGKDWATVMRIGEDYWSKQIEITPSHYAKMLEQEGKVSLFRSSKEFLTPDVLGVTVVSPTGAFQPGIGIRRFLDLYPKEKQITYAHELLHLEPYLKTGKMGSESYAYWNEEIKRFYKPTLYEELKGWQPKLEGDKLVGPSYYETHPSEVPGWEHTWFEKQIAKYGKPVTSQDLFTPEAWKKFAKTDAEPYRPKFIEKPTIDPRAKGVIFWSGGYPLYEGGSKYRFPIVIPISYKGYSTTPKDVGYPKIPKYDSSKYIPSPLSYPKSPYVPSPIVVEIPKYYTSPIPKSPKITYPKSPEDYYPPSPKTSPPTSPSYPYTNYSPTQIPPGPPPTKGFILETSMIRERKEPEPEGFNVYIKDRTYVHGKKKYSESWKKANTTPLSEQAALSLGSTAVDQSAAASFKIKAAEGTARPLKIGVDPWGMLSSKFYKNKDTYIESTSNRIDSSGEIKGISALGWIANQRKTVFSPTPSRIDYKPQTTRSDIGSVYSFDFNKIMRGFGL